MSRRFDVSNERDYRPLPCRRTQRDSRCWCAWNSSKVTDFSLLIVVAGGSRSEPRRVFVLACLDESHSGSLQDSSGLQKRLYIMRKGLEATECTAGLVLSEPWTKCADISTTQKGRQSVDRLSNMVTLPLRPVWMRTRRIRRTASRQ